MRSYYKTLATLNVGITFNVQEQDYPSVLRQLRAGTITVYAGNEFPDFPDTDSVITTFGSTKGVMTFRFNSYLTPDWEAKITQARTTTDPDSEDIPLQRYLKRDQPERLLRTPSAGQLV